MSLLHYLSYGGAVAAFIFITLSLASGLLWLSELIEEHSRSAKAIGQRGIYAIILIHILLWYFDSLPLHLTLFSILCHIVYLQNFTPNWPVVSLTSLSFLASCALVIIDHFLWFFYFARVTQNARHRARTTYPRQNIPVPGFADIATFFGVCVWLAPLFLFLSLSANDNALPMNLSGAASVPSTPALPSHPVPPKPQRTSLFKSLYDALPLDSLPRMRPRSRRDASQGIIAPQSPRPPTSPLPSPGLPGMRRNASSGSLPPYTTPPPPRRVSSDSPGLLYADPSDITRSPEPFSSGFALGVPPSQRRPTAGPSLSPSLRRAGLTRTELRRAASSGDTLDPDR